MQKLLSLPPNLIDSFHQLEEVNHTDWFCTSDPVGSKLGSGGGTTWLLQACHQAFAPAETFRLRTVMSKSFGAPSFFGSSVRLYCVFAIQIGALPNPRSVSCFTCFWAAAVSTALLPP